MLVEGNPAITRFRMRPEGRLRIEASDDGNAWETVWLDWIGGPAMAAALDDPLVVPLRIPLSNVRARYLQIYPAPAWLERELIEVTIADR